MKLYKNCVIGCLARLEFCNSLYSKELIVFSPSYFVDHHPISNMGFSASLLQSKRKSVKQKK
jgi:hypothetical protein